MRCTACHERHCIVLKRSRNLAPIPAPKGGACERNFVRVAWGRVLHCACAINDHGFPYRDLGLGEANPVPTGCLAPPDPLRSRLTRCRWRTVSDPSRAKTRGTTTLYDVSSSVCTTTDDYFDRAFLDLWSSPPPMSDPSRLVDFSHCWCGDAHDVGCRGCAKTATTRLLQQVDGRGRLAFAAFVATPLRTTHMLTDVDI